MHTLSSFAAGVWYMEHNRSSGACSFVESRNLTTEPPSPRAWYAAGASINVDLDTRLSAAVSQENIYRRLTSIKKVTKIILPWFDFAH